MRRDWWTPERDDLIIRHAHEWTVLQFFSAFGWEDTEGNRDRLIGRHWELVEAGRAEHPARYVRQEGKPGEIEPSSVTVPREQLGEGHDMTQTAENISRENRGMSSPARTRREERAAYALALADAVEASAEELLCAAHAIRLQGGIGEPVSDALWRQQSRVGALASAAFRLLEEDFKGAQRFWWPARPLSDVSETLTQGRNPDSPLRWFGSKYRLIPFLLPLLPPHHTWVDVFFGGGSVTLAKPPSPVEVANDLDGRIVGFFRVLQDPVKSRRLRHLAELTPYSLQWFEEIREGRAPWHLPPADDVEEAYRFFVVNRMAFSGTSSDRWRPFWSRCVTETKGGVSGSVAVWQKSVEDLPLVTERLQRIQFDQTDFREVLRRYDTPNTLFYLDPPYEPSTRVKGGYRHELTADDHRDMVGMLLGIQGKAILSGYECETYRPLEDAGWRRMGYEVSVACSTQAKKSRRTESVWVNPAAQTPGLFSADALREVS